MKRLLTTLVAVLVLSFALCVSAAASDFDTVAEELAHIGMFRGTGTSFELDRAPTRAEAAIMLVRLYGAEEQATADYAAGKISHPFKDVPSYSAAHVAWLYEKGLTKGIGGNAYGSTANCNAQSYATFLLRALGYQDDIDFTYDIALEYAQEKGFYDPDLFSGEFLRDDLAALTYQALATDMKGGSTWLLASLVDSGAISDVAAQPMMKKMVLFRQMVRDTAFDDTAASINTVTKMDITMDMNGFVYTLSNISDDSIDMRMSGDTLQMAYTSISTDSVSLGLEDAAPGSTVSESNGTKTTTSVWIKDGWVYVSTASDGVSMKVKYPIADGDTAPEELDTTGSNVVGISGLALVKSITAEKVGSNTVYTLAINGNLGGMDLTADLADEDTQITAMEINDISAVYTVGHTGLKNATLQFSANVNMNVTDESGYVTPVTAIYDYEVNTTVKAVGNQVRFTYPSFSGYVTIDLSLLEN